jgi:hypothetical protein
MVSSPAVLALNHPVVVSFITSHVRVSDLPSLCLTTKSFHSSATRRLYHSLILTNPSTAFLGCETLTRTPSLATHVRGLVLGQGPPHVWQALQRALEALPRLEAFAIDARGIRLSWVLPLAPSFRLRDLRLCIPWDAQVAAFVRTQTTLRALWVLELAEDYRPSATSARSRGAADTGEVARSTTTAEVADLNSDAVPEPKPETLDLPLLHTAECPLSLAHNFVRSPLTHLQVLGDSGAVARATDRDALLLRLIPRLACTRKTLRSLSLYDVPEARTADVVALAAQHCPQLRYLGTLPLPAGPVRPALSVPMWYGLLTSSVPRRAVFRRRSHSVSQCMKR